MGCLKICVIAASCSDGGVEEKGGVNNFGDKWGDGGGTMLNKGGRGEI